jgi:hypothetical protein
MMQRGFHILLQGGLQSLFFLNTLFGRAIACAILNQAIFIMRLSAPNTYQVIPGNLNLFFVHQSANFAIPNCSVSASSCEFYSLEINVPPADSRALDKQL